MEPPLGSSTVVSARRTLREGIVADDELLEEVTIMAFSFDSSLTSVLMRSEMRPSDMTTGEKPSPTPNGLNSIVIFAVLGS